MVANTWAEVGTNTLDDINPRYDSTINPNYPNTPPWNGWTGHQSIIIAWCLNGARRVDVTAVAGGLRQKCLRCPHVPDVQ